MTGEPYCWQGSLDGLCGHYAIVNALTYCGVFKSYKQQQVQFKKIYELCPVIYDGMEFMEMKSILSQLVKERIVPEDLMVSAPFEKKKTQLKRHPTEYLNQLLQSNGAKCAIIQIQRSSDDWEEHWIVVTRKAGRFCFIDSVKKDGELVFLKNPQSLGVGHQTKKSTSSLWHLIQRRQCFLFSDRKVFGVQ